MSFEALSHVLAVVAMQTRRRRYDTPRSCAREREEGVETAHQMQPLFFRTCSPSRIPHALISHQKHAAPALRLENSELANGARGYLRPAACTFAAVYRNGTVHMVAMGEGGGGRFNGAEMGPTTAAPPLSAMICICSENMKLPTTEPATNSQQLHPLNAVGVLSPKGSQFDRLPLFELFLQRPSKGAESLHGLLCSGQDSCMSRRWHPIGIPHRSRPGRETCLHQPAKRRLISPMMPSQVLAPGPARNNSASASRFWLCDWLLVR